MKVWIEKDDGTTQLIPDVIKRTMKTEDDRNTITGLIMLGTMVSTVGMFIQFGIGPSLIGLGVGLILIGAKR